MARISLRGLGQVLESFAGRLCHLHNSAHGDEEFTINCDLSGEGGDDVVVTVAPCRIADWPSPDTHLVELLEEVGFPGDGWVLLRTETASFSVYLGKCAVIERSTFGEAFLEAGPVTE